MVSSPPRSALMFVRTIDESRERLGFPGHLGPSPSPEQQHSVRARSRIEKLGSTSFWFGFRAPPVDEDVPFAGGTRTLVRVDLETRRPVPWTGEFRLELAPHLDPAA